MIFTVEDLLEGRSTPICIQIDRSAAEAIALMTEHDFSQLPVISEDNKPVGIITADSLLRAANHFGARVTELKVRDAYEPAKTMQADGDLFDLLDQVQRSYAVIIVNAHKQIVGIVTHYDTASYFRRRAEDMMLVEDIETRLKDHISAIYGSSENNESHELGEAIDEVANTYRKFRQKFEIGLKTYLKKIGQQNGELNAENVDDAFKCFDQKEKRKGLDDLTLDEFSEVLLRHPNCPKIGTSADHSAIRQLLKDVRDIRNILAHFRDDVTADQRDKLRFCSNWLARMDSAVQKENQKAPSISAAQPPSTPDANPTDEDSKGNDSMYAPLATFLIGAGGAEMWLNFEQIEGILNHALPTSARAHRAWWANDRSHSHARQWLDAGWKVKTVSDSGVSFSRIKEREETYNMFFNLLVASLKRDKQITPPEPEPNGLSYFRCAILRGSKKRQVPIYASFARNGRLRIELYLGLGDRFLNKRCWQILFDRRAEIERAIGEPLGWERLDNKDAARVAMYYLGPIGASTDPSVVPWATNAVAKMISAFREPIKQALDLIQDASGNMPASGTK